MCSVEKEIKFCTCGEIEKPDWKLTRVAELFSMPTFILGSYFTSEKDIEDDQKRNQIERKLNENTLFDIPDYKPQEHDVLEVFGLAIYEYKNGKWNIESTYHPFGYNVSVIKNDYSEVIKGKIE